MLRRGALLEPSQKVVQCEDLCIVLHHVLNVLDFLVGPTLGPNIQRKTLIFQNFEKKKPNSPQSGLTSPDNIQKSRFFQTYFSDSYAAGTFFPVDNNSFSEMSAPKPSLGAHMAKFWNDPFFPKLVLKFLTNKKVWGQCGQERGRMMKTKLEEKAWETVR